MNDMTPEERNSKLHEIHAHGHLKMIHWAMNLGQIIASQAALMAAHGIIPPQLATRQVNTIRELLASDPNTVEVVSALDRLLLILPPDDQKPPTPSGELVPPNVLERLRAMRKSDPS